MKRYDIIIIGGGVGGLVAASGAAQLGAKVALIEKKELGGDCLHYGCVPTKRLVQSAKVAHLVKHAGDFGLEGEPLKVNFSKVMQGMRKIQTEIGKHDAPERFRNLGVNVLFGQGRFVDSRTFEINSEKLYGKNLLIATGSRPIMPPIPGLKEAGAVNNETALNLEGLPMSISILGAGPIGIEFAQIFKRLGAKVTVMEKMGQILPGEDKEISDLLRSILEEEGIEFYTSVDVKKIQKEGDKKTILISSASWDKTFAVDEIMVSTGRAPNVEDLNIESAGVYYEKKGIPVDAMMRTNVRHIFACGDVTGTFAFTHVAEYQAGIAISNALFPFVRRKADYRIVPWVTYTDPELGRCGLTEDEAKARYGGINVFRFYFKDVDRAVIEGERKGMIKLVCNRKNRILGAYILGPNAGELLHEYVLAMKANIPITKISQTIHAYPTLSQSVKRTCDVYYKEKLFRGRLPKITKWLIKIKSAV